jgi:ABC-type spermidine/putrescine transport system permease subunit II
MKTVELKTIDVYSASRSQRVRGIFLCVYALLFYAFLYSPIILLLVLSFNDSQTIGLPFRGATLRWYEDVFSSKEMLWSIGNSVCLGLSSAIIATLLALLLALGFREEFPFKNDLIFFGYSEVPFGVWTTTLPVHVTWVMPFAFLTLFPRLHGLDRSLEEAAADLGATPFVTFRRVTFPLIKPGVVATAMFAFTLSFDEFIRTLFVIGNQRTVPVHLWTLLSDQMAPFLPAVGVVITVISMLVSLIGFAASARADRSRPSF